MSELDPRRLADRLTEVGYTLDAVAARLTDAGERGLQRNSTTPADRVLGADRDAQATLIRLFLLQQAVSEPDAAAALGASLAPLVAAGYVVAGGDGVRAGIEIRPYAAQGPGSPWDGWVCHDLTPGLDGPPGPVRPDFVLGVSSASTTLAQLTIREPVGRALDLGCGCGVQTLHLARHADEVVATDLNPRALELARLTLALSGVDADLRLGSLYEPVAGERFDLIVSNPPYVMAPPTRAELTYREGQWAGDDLVRRVIAGAGDLLTPAGTMQVLANWAITDEPVAERLRSWTEPTGCDALVLERERLDPFEYIELWLADAGLAGHPDYAPRYREWLDYFDRLGITGVGMGWFSLRAGGRATPDFQYESWPHAVHDPGAAFAAHWRGLDAAAATDGDLLAQRLVLDRRVTQETVGRPGAPDPEHVVLRQGYGLGRAREVDTALGAIVGACDGELTVAQLVGAVASLLEADTADLGAAVLPQLRELLREGYLTPA